MPDAQGIRAGRAFVELFAAGGKLVRGLRRASAMLPVALGYGKIEAEADQSQTEDAT